MTIGIFLVAFGLALRLTRLMTTDSITQPVRMAIARKQGASGAPGAVARWFTGLLACDWCSGVWASWFAFGTAYLWADERLWLFLAAAAGASYLIGLAQALVEYRLYPEEEHDHDHA